MNCDHEDVTLDAELARHDVDDRVRFEVKVVLHCNVCNGSRIGQQFLLFPVRDMVVPDSLEELTNGSTE